MAEAVKEERSLRDKLSDLRRNYDARYSQAEGAKTETESDKLPAPSTVLPNEPSIPQTSESERGPVPVPVMVPEALPSSSGLKDPLTIDSTDIEPPLSPSSSPSTPAARVGEMEFAIPLPMNARVRDQYEQVIYDNYEGAERFTQDGTIPTSESTQSMQRFIRTLKDIAIHPDLTNEHIATQNAFPIREEGKWAEYSGSKFQVLRHLVNELRYTEMNVAILAKPGRLLDILEAFLKAHYLAYRRPDKQHRSEEQTVGRLNFTLLPTGPQGASCIVSSAAAVIAFDDSFNPDERHVKNLRADLFQQGKLAPVVLPIVFKSVEHIERCLPLELDDTDRLHALVTCVLQLRSVVGQLPPNLPPPDTAAKLFAPFLRSRGKDKTLWTPPLLPGISSVEVIVEDSDNAPGSVSDGLAGEQTVVVSRKRSLPDEKQITELSGKKPRLSPNTQEESTPRTKVVSTESELSKATVVESTDEQTAQIDEMSNAEKLRELQSAYDELSQIKQGLEDDMDSLETRLHEHVADLSQLQLRYEDRESEVRTIRKERDAAITDKERSEARRETQSNEVLQLKETRTQLQTQLDEARSALTSSANPSIAQLEQARQEAREAQAEKIRLEHRLDFTNRDFEFTRTQYQQASSAAAEATSKVGELGERIKDLERKADGEARRLKEMNAETAKQKHDERVQQLELLLEDREEQIQRKEEELRHQARFRGLATRASSVPRSPRTHASRASSPAPPPLSQPLPPATGSFSGSAALSTHPLRHSHD